MDHPEEIDVGKLLEAMVERLKARFPAFKTVEEYAGFKQKIATPALAIEVSSIEQADEGRGATGQIDATLRCSAYILVSYKTVGGKKPTLRAATAAAALMAYISGENWDQPVSLAEDIGAYPDEIPGNQEYEVWRVDWQHEGLLGENALIEGEFEEGEFIPPTEIYIGHAPRIGPGNEAYYQRTDTLPEVAP